MTKEMVVVLLYKDGTFELNNDIHGDMEMLQLIKLMEFIKVNLAICIIVEKTNGKCIF